MVKKINIKTPFGNFDIHVKEGTQLGESVVLRAKGFHDVHGRGVGDIVIKINIDLPKKLSRKQEEIIKLLNAEGL